MHQSIPYISECWGKICGVKINLGILSNLENYGNTSAATIPIMLDEAVRDGRIKSKDLIASSGFGAGLSWGVALFRWHGKS